MKQVSGLIFQLISIFLLIGCVVLSFKDFPFALVSFVGYGIVLTAVGVVFGVWFNPDKSQGKARDKFITSIIGVLLLFFGNWVIDKGGLYSISLGELTLPLTTLGWISGICSGIMGTHRDDFKA